MFENGHDENLNHMHAVQPYDHLAMVGPSENNSLVYPVENRVHFPPPWNPTPRPNGFSSSNHNVEVAPQYQPDLSGPSHEPFRLPNGTTFSMVPENYPHHAPSSTYDRQPYHGVEGGGFVDLTMGNGRGSYKRKSPGIPTVCERGSTSRYYNGATSSDLSIMQEKPNTDSQHFPWGHHISMPPSYKGDNLSIGDEGCTRNVRSRPARDFESNLARTHLLSTSSSHHPYSSSHPIDHSSNVSAGEWNHIPMSPAAHGRILVSDTGSSSHETNHSIARNSNTEIGRYPNDFISNRFPPMVPRNFHGSSSSQSARGVRSNFLQRSAPSFRPSSSSSNSLRLGNMNSSDNGFQFVAERHPRSSSNMGWRNNDRNGRLRICNERCPSFSDEAGLHDQMTPGGLVIMDRASLFGSRNLFDQHEDMRLDIDEMGYEELLALGERIGHVSTGLSEDLISKSLRETIYCSSDQNQDEETCAICLEEYKNMDDIGMMKTCGHDYHVACIKQWLTMKNTCPICKATALAENMKIR